MESQSNGMQPREFDTIAEAFYAASQATAINHGAAIVGILYHQGGRKFICASLEIDFLLELIEEIKPPSKKEMKNYYGGGRRNRPIDPAHKREIREYLKEVDTYILPPFLLSSQEPFQIFRVNNPGPAVPCVFVLPRGHHLCVTDGQHRLEGLRQARDDKPQLGQDAVAVSIVEEQDVDQTHQDFYDAAQTKPLAAGDLVEFDHREPLNSLTRELVKTVTIFQDRIKRTGTTISKGSLDLFTNNMIKRAICAMLTGNPWNEAGAGSLAAAAKDLWYKRILQFLEVFTKENPQWADIAHRSPSEGHTVEIPRLREECVHVIGAGLFVLSGVANTIFEGSPTGEAALTPEQLRFTHKLAKDVDWRRSNPLWTRSIISPTGVTPHRGSLYLAMADVKAQIGLPLTSKDHERITDADAHIRVGHEHYTEANKQELAEVAGD